MRNSVCVSAYCTRCWQKMLAAQQEKEIEHFSESGILCLDHGVN